MHIEPFVELFLNNPIITLGSFYLCLRSKIPHYFALIQLLKDLDLKGAAKAWENMLQNPQSLNEMTTEDVIELILSTEQNDRAIRLYIISPRSYQN